MRTRTTAVVAASLLLLVSQTVRAGTASPSPSASPTASASAGASPTPTSTPAPAPSGDPLAQQLQQAAAQQLLLSQTKSSLTGEIAAGNAQEQQMVQLIQTDQKQIAQTMHQLAAAETAYQTAMTNAAEQLTIEQLAQERELSDRALLAQTIHQAYMDNSNALAYILSGSSLQNSLDRAAELNHLNASVTQIATQVEADAAQALAAENADLADEATEQSSIGNLSTERTQLNTQTITVEALIATLQEQTGAASSELSKVDSQSLALAVQIANERIEQLDNTIAQAEEEDWEAAEYYIQHHLSSFPFAVGSQAGKGTTGTGQLIWPAPHTVITQPFGPTSLTMEPPMFGYPHFHTGIDLAGTMGLPVYAAGGGIVVSADSSTVGYGNHIIIAVPGGLLTLYGHLEAMLVQPGDKITQGELIGLLGSTGNSTGPHLHFEVRVDNIPVNPLPYLPPLKKGEDGPSSTAG